METIAECGCMSSLEIAEVNPILDHKNRSAVFTAELIASSMGQRISVMKLNDLAIIIVLLIIISFVPSQHLILVLLHHQCFSLFIADYRCGSCVRRIIKAE